MAQIIIPPTPSTGGTPSGSNTQIQFNDGGAFGGATGVTYNKTTQITTFIPLDNQSGITNTANSLTGSNAQSLVSLSQTWNTTGTPSLLNFTVTDTASNASSRFATFITGTARRAEIRKNGGFYAYNAFTDASNNEFGFVDFASNIFRVGTARSGTGTNRAFGLYTNGTLRAQLTADYDFGFQTDAIGFLLNGGGGMPFLVGNASGHLSFDTAISGSFSMRIVRRTADPAAPAANSAHLYVKDNGSGKMQLAVRFPTGAVQIVATEP